MIRQGHDYQQELNALYFAALYVSDRAGDIKGEADRLSVLSETALTTGFEDTGVKSMKGRVQKIRVLWNDIERALTELETQVNNL